MTHIQIIIRVAFFSLQLSDGRSLSEEFPLSFDGQLTGICGSRIPEFFENPGLSKARLHPELIERGVSTRQATCESVYVQQAVPQTPDMTYPRSTLARVLSR